MMIKNIKTKNGQALLELSIFGSLILLLLGVLVAYGLRYNFQQQAQMEAFRKAQELAFKNDNGGQPYGSATYVLVKDRHIPDPSSPFGVGQVSPFMASASVTRDSNADATAADYDGLPKLVMQFQGKVNGQVVTQERALATAGLRDEYIHIPENGDEYRYLRDKYGLIYGNVRGWCSGDGCQGSNRTITVVDYCEGEIVDYNNAIRQARLIVDQDFCTQECERGKKPGDTTPCSSVCAKEVLVPWYLYDLYHNGAPFSLPGGYHNGYAGLYEQNDTWSFPHIEQLFAFPGSGRPVQAMGIQPEYTQQVNTDLEMRKTEGASGIATTDDIYWNTTTTRAILYNDHLDQTTGIAQPAASVRTEEYSTTRSEQGSKTWQTGQ
ncbi:MAG: hypothetical protein PHS93_00035 [Candidatus Omnitrophica bacterium]|nr:hypothetical protein [Candidatus Omnitrophota bacterium]MDD5351550.1 hypothetical protein [Candidatus Omnitrophota bacterium]MDD5550985.1 hypothetical protein [Candidatus Omnitrophota bacterium]